ncbi:hypothetical protein LQZ19_11555 [Treponema primitia]|uniref:hypothetical protein n=1 Tax=Treponema primitia TaxID=88058 RepID=UPI00397F437C
MIRPWRAFLYLFLLTHPGGVELLRAEPLHISNAGNILVSQDNPGGDSISLSYTDSVVITLDREIRFFKGIELELIVPQAYMAHRGSLALALYANLDRAPEAGTANLDAQQISMEPIPNKIQIIYQIPIRSNHGMRASPYSSLPTGIVPPESFPILFRILPAIKDLGEEVETMPFRLSAKPIFSDEGAVRIAIRNPEQLPRRPFTVLVDDEVVERPREIRLLKEGEHQLVIISDDYRNENRRFLVERGKILDLSITLQDTTPLVYFEAPDKTLIFFDNEAVDNGRQPITTEPGLHEVRFQMSDYSVVKPITIQRGKTYRVALAVDVSISEGD